MTEALEERVHRLESFMDIFTQALQSPKEFGLEEVVKQWGIVSPEVGTEQKEKSVK